MFPLVLDLKRVSVLLIGQGEAFAKREAQLREYGAAHVTAIHISRPLEGGVLSADIDASGLPPSLTLPLKGGGNAIVMIAGLSRNHAEPIADACRAAGKIVNVEDVTDLCDFYFTSNVKRGDLVIAVSTGGASPTLAKKVRDVIAQRFGSEWSERVSVLADLRNALKAGGASMKEVMQKTEHYLAEKGWIA